MILTSNEDKNHQKTQKTGFFFVFLLNNRKKLYICRLEKVSHRLGTRSRNFNASNCLSIVYIEGIMILRYVVLV